MKPRWPVMMLVAMLACKSSPPSKPTQAPTGTQARTSEAPPVSGKIEKVSEEQLALEQVEATVVAAEFMLRQEMYLLENGSYLSTGTSESDIHPKVTADVAMAVSPIPESWAALRISLAHDKLHCGAVVVAGKPGSIAGPLGLKAGFSVPDTNWYYAVIRCPTTQQTFIVTFEEDKPKLQAI